MASRIVAVLAVVMVVVSVGPAADVPAKKPVGSWERKVGDTSVRFQIKPEGLVFSLAAPGSTLDVEADYGVKMSGVLFCIVKKVKKEGGNVSPAEGHLFGFAFCVAGDTLKIKDLNGTDNADAKAPIGAWNTRIACRIPTENAAGSASSSDLHKVAT